MLPWVRWTSAAAWWTIRGGGRWPVRELRTAGPCPPPTKRSEITNQPKFTIQIFKYSSGKYANLLKWNEMKWNEMKHNEYRIQFFRWINIESVIVIVVVVCKTRRIRYRSPANYYPQRCSFVCRCDDVHFSIFQFSNSIFPAKNIQIALNFVPMPMTYLTRTNYINSS